MQNVLQQIREGGATIHPLVLADEFINSLPSSNYKKNQFIYRENNNTDTVYFIKSGKVILSEVNEDGKEVIKAYLRAGQMFGEQSLLGQNGRNERAKAKSDAEVLSCSVTDVRKQLFANGDFALIFNQLLVKKLETMQRRWNAQVSSVARDRIIDFIVELVEKDGRQIGYEFLVHNTLTHMEIANFLGTSRQTVTVVLNELREKNLIYFDRKRLLIRDLEALKAEKNNL